MRIWAFFTATILLIILAVAGGIRFGILQHGQGFALPTICCAQEPEELPIVSHGIIPGSVYDDFYAPLPQNIERNGAQSAIVAHHLIVGKEIARVFETVGKESVRQVIIVSPNHFDVGAGPMLTGKVAWSTPYGEVRSDTSAISDLINAEVGVQEDLRPFEQEHGVNGIVPFVKRSFPNAEIVPLIVHESLTGEQAELLAKGIFNTAREDALVIASIDMSHNLPREVQQFHDDLTRMTIAGGELKHELEIDSNAGLRVLFEINRLRETQTWNETYHGSSLETGVAKEWIDNTSHILGYFTKGEPEQKEWTSFLFGGDIMLDRGTRKKILAADTSKPLGDPTYPWEHLSRMVMGVDLRVANLEGTVNEQPSTYTYDPPFRFVFDPLYVEAMKPYVDIVSLANNHAADVGAGAGQEETRRWLSELGIPWFGAWETPEAVYDFEIRGQKYRLIGYHAFKPNQDVLISRIEEGESEGRFVIVMPHWGVEYQYNPFSGQKDSAQRMVDAGADLIVGGHPHVVQGIEMCAPDAAPNGKVPVVYSLGNFVFDQQIPVTWDAMMLGVVHTNTELVLYFLPIGTKNSQPIPYGGEDAARVLNIVATASPNGLRDAILQSKLIIHYDSKENNNVQ